MSRMLDHIFIPAHYRTCPGFYVRSVIVKRDTFRKTTYYKTFCSKCGRRLSYWETTDKQREQRGRVW